MAAITGAVLAGTAVVGGAVAGALPDNTSSSQTSNGSSTTNTSSNSTTQGTQRTTETGQQSTSGTTQQTGATTQAQTGTQSSTNRTSQESLSGLVLGEQSALERQAAGNVATAYGDLNSLYSGGPGAADVTRGTGAMRDLASMLEEYQRTGGLPTEADITTAGSVADRIFSARQTQLEQEFKKQGIDAGRNAAILGRPVDDPILQAKLRQGFMDQKASLDAEKTAYATDFAFQQPQKRLDYATQRGNVLNNLATQAFQNRAALLAAGTDVVAAERNFRVQTAQQRSNVTGSEFGEALNSSNTSGTNTSSGSNTSNTNSRSTSFGESYQNTNQSGTSTTNSNENVTGTGTGGGGLKGALTGGIAGIGAAGSILGATGGFGGGGGGSRPGGVTSFPSRPY